METGWTKEGNP